MFEPIRGGTRGGQAEFKWTDVSQDKDRENYLGHSINAPTGRWQKNKDIHWYQRDVNNDEEARLEEIRLVKEQEAEALAAMLGFAAGGKPGGPSATAGPASGANAVAVPVSRTAGSELDPEKEVRRKRKAERKEEKRAKKEAKREAKEKRKAGRDEDDDDHSGRRDRHRSRSRSPRRHPRDYDDGPGSHRRSRTPPRHARDPGPYDADAREKERERERRRWEGNARREQPGARWGRD